MWGQLSSSTLFLVAAAELKSKSVDTDAQFRQRHWRDQDLELWLCAPKSELHTRRNVGSQLLRDWCKMPCCKPGLRSGVRIEGMSCNSRFCLPDSAKSFVGSLAAAILTVVPLFFFTIHREYSKIDCVTDA